MTAPVDICNQALSAIGARATIASLDEPSPAANACALHYDRLRRMLLRGAHWNFARATQQAMTQVGSYAEGNNIFPWLFCYTYPSDCLLFRHLQPQGFLLWTPSPQFTFVVQGKTILSNLYQAGAVYTRDETDCDIFDSGFQEALVAALAGHLLMPLTGSSGERQAYLQSAMQAVQMARAMDGNESSDSTTHTPDWIKARNVYYEEFTGTFPYFYNWQPLSWEGGFAY